MAFIFPPIYEDLFDEKQPGIEELLADIPSSIVLSWLCYLNISLQFDSGSEQQWQLLKQSLSDQPEETRNSIFNRIISFSRNHAHSGEVSVISVLYIRSFIIYELGHFRELPEISITSNERLIIFKAYMVIVSQKSDYSFGNSRQNTEKFEGDFFTTHTWPLLIEQFESITRRNPFPSLVRSMCFFNYLQYHSKYSEYVSNFLKENNFSNTWEYLYLFMGLYKNILTNYQNGVVSPFVECPKGLANIFDLYSVVPKRIKGTFLPETESLILLKASPLIKVGNNYCILDWDFLNNKIYDGLIFDFFNHSGIRKEFESLPNFKIIIGKEITEVFTFRKLLEVILRKKHSVLIFPENDSHGEPDLYYRNRNTITLIEIKDAYFSSAAIESKQYDKIKNEIDRKYNCGKKGTGQLQRQIARISKESIEEKSYSELKLKPRLFNIYPVIIYTDPYFGMLGVANYLSKEFEEKMQKDLLNSFKSIKKLTFLSLDFLILSFNLFQSCGFQEVIDRLHNEIERRRKKHNYKNEIPFLFSYQESHESVIESVYKHEIDTKMDVRKIMKLLNLTEGLP